MKSNFDSEFNKISVSSIDNYTNNLVFNNSSQMQVKNSMGNNSSNYVEKNNAKGNRIQNKTTVATKLSTMFIALVSAVSVMFSGVIDVFNTNKSTISVNINLPELSESSIYYSIEIYDEDIQEKIFERDQMYYSDYNYEEDGEPVDPVEEYLKDFCVVVYNNFTNREKRISNREKEAEGFYYYISEGDNEEKDYPTEEESEEEYKPKLYIIIEGFEYDLKPNMTYTIEVQKGKTVLAKKNFKTTIYEEEPYEEPYQEPSDYTGRDDEYEDPYNGSDDGYDTGSTVVSGF